MVLLCYSKDTKTSIFSAVTSDAELRCLPCFKFPRPSCFKLKCRISGESGFSPLHLVILLLKS